MDSLNQNLLYLTSHKSCQNEQYLSHVSALLLSNYKKQNISINDINSFKILSNNINSNNCNYNKRPSQKCFLIDFLLEKRQKKLASTKKYKSNSDLSFDIKQSESVLAKQCLKRNLEDCCYYIGNPSVPHELHKKNLKNDIMLYSNALESDKLEVCIKKLNQEEKNLKLNESSFKNIFPFCLQQQKELSNNYLPIDNNQKKNFFENLINFQNSNVLYLQQQAAIAATTSVENCFQYLLNNNKKNLSNQLFSTYSNYTSNSSLSATTTYQILQKTLSNAINQKFKILPKEFDKKYKFTLNDSFALNNNEEIDKKIFTPNLKSKLGLKNKRIRCKIDYGTTQRSLDIKKYRCDVCEKTFSRSNTLITHKRIHTGEKPFACSSCGRCFRQPGNLTRHAYTHTTVKPFMCIKCGKAFNRASNLHTHMRIHNASTINVKSKIVLN